MTVQKPTNFQPVCEVPGCKKGAQMIAVRAGVAEWTKTCRRHTYMDLPDEKKKLETFWPPETT